MSEATETQDPVTLDDVLVEVRRLIDEGRRGWVDIGSLGKHLGVSAKTITAMVQEGSLPPGRLIRHRKRWNLDEVDRFLLAQPGSVTR